MKSLYVCLFALSSIILCSCNDDETVEPVQEQSATKIIKNLPADIASKGYYTFYSFKLQDTIPRSDSATTKWDVAFQSTNIIVNSGSSGPGSAGAQILVGTFEDITEAPSTGYLVDNASSNAIPTGSGKGWYNYNATTHVISPIPGRVLVFRTNDNKYAKVEIASYYKDTPANPVNTDVARYYSFRVFYQNDGSQNLK